ncbi:hypothetical protein OPQ81_003766 [Rhizoctonia solani]|nr:hypothetical protein OPQ81_003766 [Rhizoctonia solani]
MRIPPGGTSCGVWRRGERGGGFRSFPGTDSGRKQEDTERRLADDGDQLTPPWFRRSDHGHKWLVVTPRTAWSDV